MLYISRASFEEKQIARKVEKALFKVLGWNNIFLTDLAIATEEEIKNLNAEKRGVDRVTDVLSFPALDHVKLPASREDFPSEAFDCGRVALGSIMICRDRAKQQACEYGHSYRREFGYLVCHGLLHLLGYDHVEAEDEKIMMETAEKIMNVAKLMRK